ncbi:hypothetical protein LZC95_38190 [Pendulispora brunnea]|uniref:Lipoprotein n=1 Tax=Pendulispora brunnea TaxID=2905690 RepID=A0ABZ2K646_9BACT
MNVKLALFAALTAVATFAPAVVGCAADTRDESNATEETGTTEGALAVGIQTVNLYANSLGLGAAQGQDKASPVATFKFAKGSIKFNTFTGTLTSVVTPNGTLTQDIADLAVILKLGTFDGVEGAAGSAYWSFTNGYVRTRNETGELLDVGFGTDGNWKTVSAKAALAAAHSRIGTFVSVTASGSSTTAKFSAGAVKYTTATGAIEDVTLTGIAGAVKNAASKLGLGAHVRSSHERGVDHEVYANGTVDFNTFTGKISGLSAKGSLEAPNPLPTYVVDLAVNLKLGTFVSSDGAAGTQTETFQNGVIVWNNHQGGAEGVLKKVTVKTAGGDSIEVPLPVANAAAANVFGTVTAIEGAAGSAYYSYTDGTIRWSNVTQTLAEVTLK